MRRRRLGWGFLSLAWTSDPLAHQPLGGSVSRSKPGEPITLLPISTATCRGSTATVAIITMVKIPRKYLISTNDDHLSVEDVALGYKQLHEIERVNRDFKHTVDVRPVYHHKRDRIKAHVLLCWLALLLIRVIENETNDTWGNLKQTLHGLMAGQHRTQSGVITQTSTPTSGMKSVLDALHLKPPKRYLELPRPNKA